MYVFVFVSQCQMDTDQALTPALPAFKPLSFWHYQALGWPVFAIAHIGVSIASFGVNWAIISNLLLQILSGFLLSLVLRQYYREVPYHIVSLPLIILRIVLFSLIFTVIWYGAFAAIQLAYGTAPLSTLLTFAVFACSIAIIYPEKLVWSALYFGIKFWRDWIVERGRTEQAMQNAQQAQLQMLRYQLNRHFLFNALNSLRAMIDEDPEGARNLITQLSEFLRYSLLSRKRSEVALRDEFEAARQYLAIEKKRYEEKLEVCIEEDPNAVDYPILSFLIQPLIENAMEFGMRTSAMPLKIWIKSHLHDHTLQVSVTNTGRWMPPSEHTGMAEGTSTGLENVRSRLAISYPDRTRTATFQKDGAVYVVLEISENRRALMRRKHRAIIVDDERPARKDLRSLFAACDNVEVVGEADSVAAVQTLIEEANPDLVLLDIQMPGEPGFDLLEKADVNAKVILVTAFDEYAIRAFEVDAVDYLLKPVNPDRLRTTMERLEEDTSNRYEPRKKLEYGDSLLLTLNNHLKFPRLKSIVLIQAAGDYSQLTLTEGKKGLVPKSMTEW